MAVARAAALQPADRAGCSLVGTEDEIFWCRLRSGLSVSVGIEEAGWPDTAPSARSPPPAAASSSTDTTQASHERSVLLPTMVLLGLPKAGTTAMHACLRTAFEPPPCCALLKEPNLFMQPINRSTENTGSVLIDSRLVPDHWPRALSEIEKRAELLDFSPNYVLHAARVVGAMREAYGDGARRLHSGRRVHFVFIYRSPIERALSEYCMFAPGLGWLWDRTRKQSVLRLSADARAAIGGRFPRLMTPAGDLNLSALHGQFATAGAPVQSLLYPQVDATCGQSGGWGWDTSQEDFATRMLAQIDQLGGGGAAGCSAPPAAALSMSRETLDEYVRRCLAPRTEDTHGGFDYAKQSVPVFQLALLLKTFPRARWTFLRYEELFARGAEGRPHQPLIDAASQLLGLPANSSAATDTCGTRGRFSFRTDAAREKGAVRPGAPARTRLERAFKPWDTAMRQLMDLAAQQLPWVEVSGAAADLWLGDS